LWKRSKRPVDPALIPWSFDIYTWFAELQPSQRILDVGSGPGSFPWTGCCSIVALDEDVNAFQTATERGPGPNHRVLGQSGELPFGNRTFDLVVCHHSLEHVSALDATLREITRVLKPDGRLYVGVPNGYGLCDAVYRFVFRGGGHVNRFARNQLVSLIENSVGVHMARWQKLYSSFIYLRRLIDLIDGSPPHVNLRPRMLWRFPRVIGAAQWLLYLGTRAADGVLRTDLAVYGWAFYFDRSDGAPIEDAAYPNVCLYCGSGHHALSVERPSPFTYRCNVCNRINPYIKPFGNTS
jgi:SAM-dependent methyltransferase